MSYNFFVLSLTSAYCRLSKEDLDKNKNTNESESIQNQKLMLVDYAVANGFLIHNVYVDEDMSGFSDRPAFKQMIKDAADGLFNIILCKHQSRFTRDMELVERYIHGYFVEWGIRFISLADNIDTNVAGNKKARQIYGLINEWYSEDLSNNIKTVFRKKMEAGQFLGAFAPYGYKKNPKNRHELVIDDEAANVVREIYGLYLEGWGALRIAASLTERKILTPALYKKNEGYKFETPNSKLYSERCGAWSSSTIKRILSNETYIGTLIQGRERKVSYKSKKVVTVPQSNWVIVKNNHEPIISSKDFWRVQKMLKLRRYAHKGKNPSDEVRVLAHVLAGKVQCADCGSTMQRSGLTRDRGTYYLRCSLAAKTKRRDCTSHCIRQDKLEAVILGSIRQLVMTAISSADIEDIAQEIEKAIKGKDLCTLLERQIAEAEVKLDETRKNIVSLYKDKLRGLINEDDFLLLKNTFDEEKVTLEKRSEQISSELVDMNMRKKNHDNILELVKKSINLEYLKHEIMNDFIDVVHIGEKCSETGNHEITISWLH